MNPEKLMMLVLAAYASFDSYSDEGSCTPDLGGLPAELPFEFQTHFKRPDKFRFRWTSRRPSSDSLHESALWTDGKQFKYNFLDEVVDGTSLSKMVAGATGISSGSVGQILNVLLPKTLGQRKNWSDISQLQSLQDETINGSECFHILGKLKTADESELWIEKRSLLIRRIKQSYVTTEEDCAQMNSQMQTEEFWLKVFPDDVEKVKEMITSFESQKMQPSVMVTIYDYLTVKVNEPVDTRLFEAL